MDIILATRNKSKIVQITEMFRGAPVRLIGLDEAGVEGEAVEDGETLQENALKKARFARAQKGLWAMADDTGFFIDALGGAPGVHSARWAGDGVSTEDILRFTMEKLRAVPTDKRTAAFRTVAAVISPEGGEWTFEGEARGVILNAPRGVCQPSMPYSSIFVPEGYEKVWAEMTPREENEISHRGKAFRLARDFFETRLRQEKTRGHS